MPIAVIPARYAAQRFPGKPLALIAGKPMVQHVYERCGEARCFSRVLVATDDARIVDAVKAFGGEAVLTSPACASGTDRVAEVARGLKLSPEAVVVNVQGDEPAVHPESLAILAKAAVLYIQVEPAESRRKNIERGKPDGAGSILHHSVPMEVMLSEYGTDDMAYLRGLSGKPDTITLERIFEDKKDHFRSRTFHLPVAFFDNRQDKTTFVREDKAKWKKDDVSAIHDELKRAMAKVASVKR